MLTIVPTPIGNLKDITLRALEVLQSVDGIICEDTRRTGLLLNHYNIKKPLLVLNDYNEQKMFPKVINLLKQGQNLALVSDAGTPLVSDPGYKLVREAIHQGIEIDSLPGPSSVITALTLSGLPPDKFFFLGYLPEKPGHRKKLLEGVKLFHLEGGIRSHLSFTVVIFVAPHKLIKTLQDIKEVFGDIELVICRELTKFHREIRREKISQSIAHYHQTSPKGEIVLLL